MDEKSQTMVTKSSNTQTSSAVDVNGVVNQAGWYEVEGECAGNLTNMIAYV